MLGQLGLGDERRSRLAPLVITIQSQVVHGHVGNSAAVLPLQAHGVTVAAVPTTLLSNHPHYRTMRGRILDAELVADLLRGVEERGLIDSAAVIVTGYLGSVANGEVVAEFVERAKATNPRLVYVCDPVIGDEDLGVFVAPGLEELFSERLVPSADCITPNQFEMELLSGATVSTVEAVVRAAAKINAFGAAGVVVTGCLLADTQPHHVETIVSGAAGTWRISTPRLPIRPAGTGDLFTSLLAAKLTLGETLPEAAARAVSACFAVLERTTADGASEMRLAQSLAELVHPKRLFRTHPLEMQERGVANV